MHPRDKVMWPIVIVSLLLLYVLFGRPFLASEKAKEDADTQRWMKEQEQKREDEEQAQRVRDAWKAFTR